MKPVYIVKFFLTLISFGFIGLLQSNAQKDVIITQANEEIRCRILDETSTRFIYAYIGPKGKILKNEIFKNLVKDFKYNKYESDLAVLDKGKKKKKVKEEEVQVVDSKKKEDVKEKGVDTPEANEPTVEVALKPDVSLEKSKEIKVDKNEQVKETRASSEPAKSESAQKPIETKEIQNTLEPLANEKVVKTEEPKASEKPKNTEQKAAIAEAKPVEKKREEVKKEIVLEKPEPVENTVAESEVTTEFKNYLKWRVGVKGGIGNIRDNSFEAANVFGLYQEKLLKGWTFGADLAFFPMEGFGFGVVYTDFKSSNSDSDINYINQMTGVEASGSISNKISRKFVGPALFFRKSIDYKTFIVLGGGPGMYFYNDKGDYNGAAFNFTGKQWGAGATLGLDFLLGNDIIGRDIILSLEAGYNYGRLAELDYGDGNGPILLDKPIVMDRLDFSVGLRFMRFPRYFKNSAY